MCVFVLMRRCVSTCALFASVLFRVQPSPLSGRSSVHPLREINPKPSPTPLFLLPLRERCFNVGNSRRGSSAHRTAVGVCTVESRSTRRCINLDAAGFKLTRAADPSQEQDDDMWKSECRSLNSSMELRARNHHHSFGSRTAEELVSLCHLHCHAEERRMCNGISPAKRASNWTDGCTCPSACTHCPRLRRASLVFIGPTGVVQCCRYSGAITSCGVQQSGATV
jgi:hypothetical protein